MNGKAAGVLFLGVAAMIAAPAVTMMDAPALPRLLAWLAAIPLAEIGLALVRAKPAA